MPASRVAARPYALALLAAALIVPARAARAQSGAPYASRANAAMCIDLPGGNMAEGTAVILYQCHGGDNQRLVVQSDGHLVVNAGRSGPGGRQMCLDHYPAGGGNGDAVRIWPCRPLGGTDSQRWVRLASGEFRNSTGRCIDIQGGVGNAGRNGNPLVLWDCPDPGNYNTRRWSERPVPPTAPATPPASPPAAPPVAPPVDNPPALVTPAGDADAARRISALLRDLVQRMQQMDQQLGAGQRDVAAIGGGLVAQWLDVVKPIVVAREGAYAALAAQGGPQQAELARRATLLRSVGKTVEAVVASVRTVTTGGMGTGDAGVSDPARVQQVLRSAVALIQQQDQLQSTMPRSR